MPKSFWSEVGKFQRKQFVMAVCFFKSRILCAGHILGSTYCIYNSKYYITFIYNRKYCIIDKIK